MHCKQPHQAAPALRPPRRRTRRQATVGAGLPVLSTLGTLLATGDRVERIEGVLSGTLSYLFNSFAPGQRFSALVADARAAGFTEPDKRDDLSGAP
jgi:homoserine dehydrogenase